MADEEKIQELLETLEQTTKILTKLISIPQRLKPISADKLEPLPSAAVPALPEIRGDLEKIISRVQPPRKEKINPSTQSSPAALESDEDADEDTDEDTDEDERVAVPAAKPRRPRIRKTIEQFNKERKAAKAAAAAEPTVEQAAKAATSPVAAEPAEEPASPRNYTPLPDSKLKDAMAAAKGLPVLGSEIPYRKRG
tara:strand:- start:882 stop:1469 length:588 start_codon:yes stop_codon:yes gene_type:complete